MSITFSFDNYSYSTKPSHDEARIIQSRLVRNMRSVELDELPGKEKAAVRYLKLCGCRHRKDGTACRRCETVPDG